MMENLNSFFFQPNQDVASPDQSPLLFGSRPPLRRGRVTMFARTRRTLRHRLGVHDLGQIDGLLQESDCRDGHREMARALNKITGWKYLFPHEVQPDETRDNIEVDCLDFNLALKRTLAS